MDDEQHKQNDIHLHSIGLEAEISDMDISKSGQIQPICMMMLDTTRGKY